MAGGGLCPTLDAAGTTVLNTEFVYSGFRGGKPSKQTEVSLVNENVDIATVGNIFFLLAYGEQFKGVTLVGKKFTSTISKTAAGSTWVHAERKNYVALKSTPGASLTSGSIARLMARISLMPTSP